VNALTRRAGELHGLGTRARVVSDGVEQRVESFGVRRAQVERDRHPRRNDVHAAWLELELPDRGDSTGDGDSRIADFEDPRRRRDQRIVAAVHRRRARVACLALEDEPAAGVAHDSGHDPERCIRGREDRTLLDVELEERNGS
jgi:hypothetical protein